MSANAEEVAVPDMEDTQEKVYQDHRLPGLTIYYRATQSSVCDSMMVFMPSALPGSRHDRTAHMFSRYTWRNLWPGSEVMAFTDPALQQAPELDGAWFIHPEHDVIAAISEVVMHHAAQLTIPYERIVFYGSSLGGFGAIAAAAHIPGSRAVAEVPQVYVANWTKAARSSLENYVLKESMADFEARYPERTRLPARLAYAENIPSIRLITNREESRLEEQRELLQWVIQSDLPKAGPCELVLTDEVAGHKTISRRSAARLVAP